MLDQAITDLMERERRRQAECIPLIASENICSPEARAALASEFVNKYAEGRPGQRYYAGNKIADELETLAEQRALELFVPAEHRDDWRANVQPLSGTAANLAVLTALLEPGDRILSMNLDAGGHLSHGHPASLTGRLFEIHEYGVDQQSGRLDYDAIAKLAREIKPQLIITGASAYPRTIDFDRFGEIAQEVGALLLADVAHLAGLIAGGVHPSPIPAADVVTMTTHKTLRGPRAAIILSRANLSTKINRGVFPGVQGGPHLNQIAATAVALYEAAQPDFAEYARQTITNAQALADELIRFGWTIITGGTDNHLLLVDLRDQNISGADAQDRLEQVDIVANANRIPNDTGTARTPSGLRLGTAAITSLSATPKWCRDLAQHIDHTLKAEPGPELRRVTATLRARLSSER